MKLLFTIALCLSALQATQALAQTGMTEGGVLRNADRMYYDMEKKQVKLEGNVQVVFHGQHLSCDRAVVDQIKQEITAEGHVILTGEKAHVEGDKLVFNYKSNTGFIYNGFVQSGQVIFEGEIVEKVSEDRYIATNAFYTACETCPPGWSFSGAKIDAQLGGYARIKRPVFRVAGVPVLILPGLIVPLKSARQSGFLVPSMDYSKKGGLALSAIYFWAIDRSQDVTLTAKWYNLRGYKLHEEYRYVLSPDSRGSLEGAWMEDRALREEYQFKENVNRWFINYNHLFELPENYVHRANFKMLSDLRYARDFPEEVEGHGDPALENKTSISKLVDNQYLSLEADMYTNMLHSDPLARNEDAVHRAPEIRYSIKEQSIADTGLYGALGFNYVNFTRSTYRYDDLEPCVNNSETGKTCLSRLAPRGAPRIGSDLEGGSVQHDGVFDPTTDLYRTGQRMDIQPSISYPFHILNAFDLRPSVTYRETQYRFDPPCAGDTATCQPAFSETAARRYVQTDIVAKTEFSGVFGNMTESATGSRWKHVIEPEVGYSHTPWMRRPNHDFFGNNIGQQYSRQFEPLKDADLGNPNSGVQFDYNDRTYDRRVVNYTLRNRLTRKDWTGATTEYKTLALFQLSQSYDFNEASRPHNSHAWSTIDALIDVRLEKFETYTTASYNPYARRTDTSSRVKFKRSSQDYLQVYYTQKFKLNEEDFTPIVNGETRYIGIGAGFITKYFEADGVVNFSDITKQIQDWTYGIKFRPPGNCWLIQVVQRQVLGGDPSIHGSINFNFGGETNPTKIN